MGSKVRLVHPMVFVGTAALAILFFRDGDQMLQALIALSGAGRMQAAPAFADALPGFLKLTAPGAAAGAMFVAGSLYAYRGLLGWVKAFLITVPFALTFTMSPSLTAPQTNVAHHSPMPS